MIKKLFKIAFGPVPYLSQGVSNKEQFVVYFKGHTKRTLAVAAIMVIVTIIELALILLIYAIQKMF